MEAVDFVRRDLSEFTTTVKTDTETYLNKIKSQEVGFQFCHRSSDIQCIDLGRRSGYQSIRLEIERFQ